MSDANPNPTPNPQADLSTEPVAPPDTKRGRLPGTPPDIDPIAPGASASEEHETGASGPTPAKGAP
jgi:hypothetical protein